VVGGEKLQAVRCIAAKGRRIIVEFDPLGKNACYHYWMQSVKHDLILIVGRRR